MAKPTTRLEFKQYCLRKLGWPALKINVTDEQVEDRIDEAISYWQDYHYDGSEIVYYKHKMTAQDIQQGYVDIPQGYLGVVRIFELSSSYQSADMFSVQYQFMQDNLQNLTQAGLANYVMSRQYIEMLNEWFNGAPLIRFNRLTNKLYIDVTGSKLVEGAYIIVEAHAPINQTYSEIWSDRWLQNYATVLIKENWGTNTSKFSNGQLVSGIMFNGEKIYEDAKAERQKLEEEVLESYGAVLGFSIG